MHRLKQIVGLGCIVFCLMAVSPQELWAQELDWRTFESYVFGVAGEASQGRGIDRGKIDQIDNYLSAFMSQGQCPTPQACQSMKYIILTIRNVANGSGDSNQQIAFLRQAVHNYGSAAPAGTQQQQQNAAPQQTALSQMPAMQEFAVNYVYRPAGAQQFRQLEDGGEMRSGDLYKIIFRPQEDSFVYIFQVDSSGMIYALYPMQSFRGVRVDQANPVRAGQDYYLPSRDKSFKLDNQTGPERFFFLVSRTQDHALERDFQQLVNIQNEGQQAPPQAPKREEMLIAQAEFTRAIINKGPAVIVSDSAETESASWQEGGTDFSVLRQRLAGAGDSSVHVLSFTHK